jgi:hypothetical protein
MPSPRVAVVGGTVIAERAPMTSFRRLLPSDREPGFVTTLHAVAPLHTRRLSRAAAAATVAFVLVAARPARAEEAPLPMHRETVRRETPAMAYDAGARRTSMEERAPLPLEAVIVPGVVGGLLFLGGYLLSVLAAADHARGEPFCGPGAAPSGAGLCYATGSSDGTGWSYVPVFGPFVAAGEGVSPGPSIAAGFAQLVGVAVLAAGIPLGVDAIRSRHQRASLSLSGTGLVLDVRF